MTSNKSEPLTQHNDYKEAGVDIDAADQLVERIKPMAAKTCRPGVMAGLGGFGCLFDLKEAGYRDPILVSANDGVGTKLKIAIETGHHQTVGIDLVAMCVNDLLVQGAEPLFFLDYYATGALRPEVAADVISGIAKGCEIAGCALIGGETAEMPGMYHGDDYDLAGFVVGAVERDNLIDGSKVQEGDIILGLASDGLHSNGFSLVRKLVQETQGANYAAPAPFETTCKTLGEALLHPTRIYVRPVLAALQKSPNAVHAMAHITGGGLLENIPRSMPRGLCAKIYKNQYPAPKVLSWIKDIGNMSYDSYARTFNTGIGYVMIVSLDHADMVSNLLEQEGERVYQIGEVIKDDTQPIILVS